jgi:hypothetical protein
MSVSPSAVRRYSFEQAQSRPTRLSTVDKMGGGVKEF